MHLYYTAVKDENPLVTFDRVGKNIDRTIAVIDRTVQRIENRDFYLAVADRPGKLCGDCDMRHYCDSEQRRCYW